MKTRMLPICLVALIFAIPAQANNDLYFAVEDGHKDKLERLLEAGADVNSPYDGYPAEAYTYFTSGIKKFMKKDHAGAVSDYTQAIGTDPDNAAGYEMRSREYQGMADYSAAVADMGKAVALAPANATYQKELDELKIIATKPM